MRAEDCGAALNSLITSSLILAKSLQHDFEPVQVVRRRCAECDPAVAA